MALLQCPECGGNVSDKAASCPHCGYPMAQASKITVTRKNQRGEFPKLPNGFGIIQHLRTGNRVNPFCARTSNSHENKVLDKKTSALGYYSSWGEALEALIKYHVSKGDSQYYLPGLTKCLLKYSSQNPNNAELSKALKIIIRYDTSDDYVAPASYDSLVDAIAERISPTNTATFSEVYKGFYEAKFIKSKKSYALDTRRAIETSYKKVPSLHNCVFSSLTNVDLQEAIDKCPEGYATHHHIVYMLNGMYKYAILHKIVDMNYAKHIELKMNDNEKGEPFSPSELEVLWENKDDCVVRSILLMIYSGYRISAYKTIEINLDEKYFRGGVKTTQSKNRIVPIHPLIYDFARQFKDTFFEPQKFRKEFTETLNRLNILYSSSGKKHTPHDTRHTFSWLCDTFSVDSISKRLLMGHTLGTDVEESTYSHRTISQLTNEICKIKRDLPEAVGKDSKFVINK